MPTHAILLRPASTPLSRQIAATLGVAFCATLGLAYVGTAGLRERQQALLSASGADASGLAMAARAPSVVSVPSTVPQSPVPAGTPAARTAAPLEAPPLASFALRENAPGRYLPAGLAPLKAWASYLNRHPEQRIVIHLHGPAEAAQWEERRRLAAVLRLLSVYGVGVHRIRLGEAGHDSEGLHPGGAAAEAKGVTVTLEIDRA